MYQGEELGLFEVEDLKHEDLQDPTWHRNVIKKIRKDKPSGLALIHTEKGRDGCRVPLPWVPVGKSFGFSKTGKSHLPQPEWFKDFAVEMQKGIKGTTLEMYREALALRKVLQTEEELKWIPTTSTEVLHFVRPNGWHCIMNFNAKPYKMPKGEILISSGPIKSGKIPPNTTIWFRA
jgi:alpha-glucosidase